MLIAIAVGAATLVFLRVQVEELAAEYKYTGTVDIEADFGTFWDEHAEGTELTPFLFSGWPNDPIHVNGIRIHVSPLKRKEHEHAILGVVFEVGGNGLNHAEKRRQMEAEMDAFVRRFPDIKFGLRRIIVRSPDGTSRELITQ